MAVIDNPAFTFTGNEAENLNRALSAIRKALQAISMRDLRLIVCRIANGSYAELSRYVAPKTTIPLVITLDQALLHRNLIRSLSEHLPEVVHRRILTWSTALLKDLDTIGKHTAQGEKYCGNTQTGFVVETPEDQRGSERKTRGRGEQTQAKKCV